MDFYRKILFLVVLLFAPVFYVAADTPVSGAISSDTTWSPAGGVYIVNSNFSVASGTTLTIEAGTIIKAKISNIYIDGPSIYGRLIVNGTSELPVNFTSYYDDSIGGDTNADGLLSAGAPGQWQGLYFKSGSEGDLNYVDLSYAGVGGYGWGNFVGIENDGGLLNIQNSNIHDNYGVAPDGAGGLITFGTGVYNKSGTLSVFDSSINNNLKGIGALSGVTTISNTVLENNRDSTGRNRGYGIFAQGEGKMTLINNTFINNEKTADINVATEFVHSGNVSSDSEKGFKMGGQIVRDTSLNSNDLPTLISGGISVPAGKVLTLEPGTIIKLGDPRGNGAIRVHGILVAKGTKEAKIYLTSQKDDIVGGDSNGDGNASVPGPRNWNGVFLEAGSKANFDNVTLRYSGFNYNGEYLSGIAAAVYQRGAEFLVSNSLFERNWSMAIYQDAGTTNINRSEFREQSYGILSRGGEINISQSSLHNNTVLAVYNQSGPLIEASNNWWGSPDGPKDASTSTPTGTGDRVSANVIYKPWLGSDPLVAPPEPETPDPVVIIPGIMGSAYKNGELIIDPILHTYDDLIATLIANGYIEGKDLFAFPYEWRDSNVLTAAFLRNKISSIKEICECDKVDIVAHSMGGLVARQYIQSANYADDVDQIIFLGTPHKGAPTDYLFWEAGKFPTDFDNFFREAYFSALALRNGYLTIFDYIHEKPISSVQELLPIYDYIKDSGVSTPRIYPDNYPRNIFLENLESNIQTLFDSGVEIFNLVGGSTENVTIEKIRVIPTDHPKFWEHGEPEGFGTLIGDNGLERGVGDDTVPAFSSFMQPVISEVVPEASHNRIPTLAANRIIKILTGEDSITNIDNGFHLDTKVLLIQLLSPIDVVVTDPNGRKVGKNFETGGEYNEIPLAFYSGYQTDDEYITILDPLDGEYKVELQGTGSGGEYEVVTNYITEDIISSTEFSAVIGLDQITDLSFSLKSEEPESMELTIDGDLSSNDLVSYINSMYQIGWIKDKKTVEKLTKWTQSIIRFEDLATEVGVLNKVIDKKLAKMLENELPKLLEKDQITLSAYNFLKMYINLLLNS